MLFSYLRYAALGTVVGITVVLLREVLALFLPDQPIWYVFGIMVVYVVGIALSFQLQRRYTFSRGGHESLVIAFTQFGMVSIVGAVLVGMLSFGIRYGLDLDRITGSFAPTIAFVVAALLASVATFLLNARWVFRPR